MQVSGGTAGCAADSYALCRETVRARLDFYIVSEDQGQEPDWLAELAKGGEELRRQAEPIARAAQQFIRDARHARARGGAPLPFAQRIALAVDAGIRELLPTREPAVFHLACHGTLPGAASLNGVGTLAGVAVADAAALVGVRTIMINACFAAAPMRSAAQGTRKKRLRGLAELSDGQIVFLVFVWIYAVFLPWFGSALPPELHGMLTDGYATFALALAITWRMLDKKR